jgi:alpha-tubulin suppressor-like RCC1 family protein
MAIVSTFLALVLLELPSASAGGGGLRLGFPHAPAAVVEGLPKASALATRASTTCALSSGTVWCWGKLHQLGVDRETHRPTKVRFPGDIVQLSLGGRIACAVGKNADAWCFIGGKKPKKMFDDVKTVSAGEEFACAIKNDGTVWCFGENSQNQLGQAPSGRSLDLADTTEHEPELPSSPNVSNSDGDATMTQALASALAGSNRIETWPLEAIDPIVVPGIRDAVDVAAGHSSACVVHATGAVTCWGGRVGHEAGSTSGTGRSKRFLGARTRVKGVNDALSISPADLKFA